jgi:enoyl-CoA hydratase/carnithine racemase
MPGLRFGIALGTRRLAARIGSDAARRMLAAGDTLDATEAGSLGIATSVASPGEWPSIVASAADMAARLAPEAGAALRRLTIPDTRDADLADLVRTAAMPGIRDRIRAFRSPN